MCQTMREGRHNGRAFDRFGRIVLRGGVLVILFAGRLNMRRRIFRDAPAAGTIPKGHARFLADRNAGVGAEDHVASAPGRAPAPCDGAGS